MTKTVQPRSQASLSEAGNDLTINEPEAEEDNMSLLLQVFDNLNNLCEELNRLDYVLKRKNMELYLMTNVKEK
jgi:hypothetical protein